MIRVTSEADRAGRCGVPPKITSSILPPRSTLGRCSPRTSAPHRSNWISTAVWSDDDGDALSEYDLGGIRERLEAGDFYALELHEVPHVALAAAARATQRRPGQSPWRRADAGN